MLAKVKKTGEEIVVSSFGCGFKGEEYGHLYYTGGEYSPKKRIYLKSELEFIEPQQC